MKNNIIKEFLMPLIWVVFLSIIHYFSGIETVIVVGMSLLLSKTSILEEK